jgi:hypothetical protein
MKRCWPVQPRLAARSAPAEWQRSGRTFTGVVFVRQLGLDLGRVIEDLELLVRVCSADDVRGRVVFVPL